MAISGDLAEHFLKKRALLREQFKLLGSGAPTTGEKTVEHPQWKDTTKESLERVRWQIGEIKAILARHGYAGWELGAGRATQPHPTVKIDA